MNERIPIGTTGAYVISEREEQRHSLALFLVAVEAAAPRALEDLRDLAFPPINLGEITAPGVAPLAALAGNLSQAPHYETCPAWEARYHLDRWRTEQAQADFRGIVRFVLESWWHYQAAPMLNLPPIQEPPGFTNLPAAEFGDLVRRSRSTARWAELILSTRYGDPSILYSDLMADVSNDDGAPEAVRAFIKQVNDMPPPYDPLLFPTRRNWLDRAEAYCSRVDEAASRLRLRRAQTKTGMRDFRWLALYQVAEIDYNDLSDELMRDPATDPDSGIEATLRQAIQRTARLVGIRLRRARRRRR